MSISITTKSRKVPPRLRSGRTAVAIATASYTAAPTNAASPTGYANLVTENTYNQNQYFAKNTYVDGAIYIGDYTTPNNCALSYDETNAYLKSSANKFRINDFEIERTALGVLDLNGAVNVQGDINIWGDIYQHGTAYETHAEHLYTAQDLIISRDGATAALAALEYSGLKILKANGTNNLIIGGDNTGYARVGWENDTMQKIATRADSLTNNYLTKYDSANHYLTDTTIYETGGTLYTGSINFGNEALIASYAAASNIDHIWHDDNLNAWHFVSDSTYKAAGNSAINVGLVNSTGNITSGANLVAATYLQSSTNAAVLGTASQGTVYLRPYAYNSSTAQTTFTTTAATIGTNLSVSGTGTFTGALYTNNLNQRTTDGLTITAANGVKINNGTTFYSTLQSETFDSNFWGGAGWQLKKDLSNEYSLTLDNLNLRGTLTVYELLIQQTRMTNGNLLVTATGKVASITTTTPGAEVITVEDPGGHGIAPFTTGDLLICQRVKLDSTTLVKRLIRKVIAVNGLIVSLSNTDIGAPTDSGTLSEGDEFGRFGSTTTANRRGSILLAADGSNSPLIGVYSDVTDYTAWRSIGSTKVIIGNLDGITDPSAGLDGTQSNYYGIYTTAGHFKGHIYSTSGQIGGFTLATSTLHAGLLQSQGSGITMDATNKAFKAYADSNNYISMYYTSATNWNLKGVKGGTTYFSLGYTSHIANLTFDNGSMYNGGKLSSGTAGIEISSAARHFSAHASASNYVKMFYTSPADYGIKDGAGKFQIGSINKIGGFTIGATSISTPGVLISASLDRIRLYKETATDTYSTTNYISMENVSGVPKLIGYDGATAFEISAVNNGYLKVGTAGNGDIMTFSNSTGLNIKRGYISGEITIILEDLPSSGQGLATGRVYRDSNGYLKAV